jgi:hypothetical protein
VHAAGGAGQERQRRDDLSDGLCQARTTRLETFARSGLDRANGIFSLLSIWVIGFQVEGDGAFTDRRVVIRRVEECLIGRVELGIFGSGGHRAKPKREASWRQLNPVIFP